MPEKNNPFINHPILSQVALVIGFAAALAADAGKLKDLHGIVIVIVMIGLASACVAYAVAFQPIAPNIAGFRFKPSTSFAVWLILTIALLVGGGYSVHSDAMAKHAAEELAKREAEKLKAPIAFTCSDAFARSTGWIDYPPALRPYTSGGFNEYTLPWKLMGKNNLNPWSTIPKTVPQNQLMEFRDIATEKARKAYLAQLLQISPMVFHESALLYPHATNPAELRPAILDQGMESFMFEMYVNDPRPISCCIQSLTITVRHFYTLPVPITASPASALDSIIALVPVKNKRSPLPWTFPATAVVMSVADPNPKWWFERKPEFSNHATNPVIVKLLPEDRGVYVYDAEMVVKDSLGHEKKVELIAPSNPRAFAAVAMTKEEFQAEQKNPRHLRKLSAAEKEIDQFYGEWRAKHAPVGISFDNGYPSPQGPLAVPPAPGDIYPPRPAAAPAPAAPAPAAPPAPGR